MATGRGIWMAISALCVAGGFAGGVLLAPYLQKGEQAPQIAPGDNFSGEITSGSPLNIKDGSRYDRVLVNMPAEGIVIFELDSSFTGNLSLLGPNGNLVAQSGATDPMSMQTATSDSVQMGYEAGEAGLYTLAISGGGSRSYGPFSLSSRMMEARNSGAIGDSEEVVGWLQGQPNRYELDVTEPGMYTITLRSQAFDSYLSLTGNGLSVEDDDNGGGLDARMTPMLMPGTYQIEARSYDSAGGNGLYTLTTSVEPVPDRESMRNDGPLTLGTPLSGWLQNGGPNGYTLEVTEPGIYRVDLESDSFDAQLSLSGGTVSAEDDDGGNGTNSRIQTLLTPGTYQVSARDLYETGSGVYTVHAEYTPLPDQDSLSNGGTLELDQTLSGWLQSGGPNLYTLEVEERGQYVLELVSSDFDAYLELRGENVFLEDDDSAGGTNSQITLDLAPGSYQVHARDFYERESGVYTLRAFRAGQR